MKYSLNVGHLSYMYDNCLFLMIFGFVAFSLGNILGLTSTENESVLECHVMEDVFIILHVVMWVCFIQYMRCLFMDNPKLLFVSLEK